MISTNETHHAFSDTTNRGLLNPYTLQQATSEQSHDLLGFRTIGEKEYFNRIDYFILKTPSVKAPRRQRRLQTFTVKTGRSKRLTQAEKDKRLVISAMMKKMQYSKKTGKPIEKPGEQLLEFPLAICDHNGDPLKGTKSYATKCLETRYKTANPPVFLNQLPTDWNPQCCLMEGMFIINTTPLGSHKTMAEYSRFIMRRYVLSEMYRGATEVHIIFDNPGCLGTNTPKYFEQKRRDEGAPVQAGHQCTVLGENTKINPNKWRQNFLHCRTCKRNLVLFLGKHLLKNIGEHLMPHQSLFIAGAFEDNLVNTTWFVKGQDRPQPHPAFTCNAEETDTRLWLHAKNTTSKEILVISPDTDVYHIGLPLSCARQKEVIIQLSEANKRQLKFLNLSNLILALENDPDLANIDHTTLPQIIQTFYASTGCDYTSFFSKMGKATFFKYFLQYASFITADTQSAPGTLADTSLSSNSSGFLAFMRLIGTAYYKKYATGFANISPTAHFLKFKKPNLTNKQQHSEWLEDIRQNTWLRTTFGNEFLPSDDSLYLHWQRTCWVCHMWHQADQNYMILEPLANHGWEVQNEKLTIVWDSRLNIEAIRKRVSHLLSGCKCITGCSTRRCSCLRKQAQCGEGCQCRNCNNLCTPSDDNIQQEAEGSELELVAVAEIHDQLEEEVDDIMDMIFGEEDDQHDLELEGNEEVDSSISETEEIFS